MTTKTNKTIAPAILHSRLQWAEVNNALAPDCRRILRGERERLGIALRRGDGRAIHSAAASALEVAGLWGVDLGQDGR